MVFFILKVSLLAASLLYKWHYSREGWSCSNPNAPWRKWAQEREPGTLRVYREPREKPAPGLKKSAEPSLSEAPVQPEFSQKHVMFYRGSKGQALHTWTQPFKFNLLTAGHEGTWILWRAVMRAPLKLTSSVCLHKAISKNHIMKHFDASALPGDWQGLGTHGLTTDLLRCLSVPLVLCFYTI